VELYVHGATVLADIQVAAIRNLWNIQARSATAFGAPDYSELLRFTDTGAKRLFTSNAEQLLSSARQASDTITELQRQFGRLVEQGSLQISEDIRQGMEELNQRTQEGLREVKDLAQQGADEAERFLHETQSHQREQPVRQVAQARTEEENDRAGKARRTA
jgi:gas vesicle protein